MNVAIIDYGSGNLRSAVKAFERGASELGGGTVSLTSDPQELMHASHIVLPGVGSFSDCMAGLLARDGMIEALRRQVIGNHKPFLGICVGMQLMANIGQENKKTNGFGWIPGEVVEISSGDSTLKIPHMGWNDLIIHKPDHPAMSGLTDGAHAYFVHSYQFVTHNPKDILATVNYGVPLTAAVAKNNLIGTQFHPEKSQQTGITFIKNFLSWQP